MKTNLIRLVKELIGFILLSLKLFTPSSRYRIISIYFHNPSPELFERIVRYLNSKEYQFISSEQFGQLIKTRQTPKKVALITIDDGWRDNLKLLDVIRRYKVFVTLFITTSAVENGNFWFEFIRMNKDKSKKLLTREVIKTKKLDSASYYKRISDLQTSAVIKRSAMTKEELIFLSRDPYITIGSHSVSHISLPGKPVDVQKSELINSKIILETWVGKQIDVFSYPSGDYTEEQETLSEECGYSLCFSTETTNIDLNQVNQYSIPRRCINDDAGYFEALSRIYGFWSLIKR